EPPALHHELRGIRGALVAPRRLPRRLSRRYRAFHAALCRDRDRTKNGTWHHFSGGEEDEVGLAGAGPPAHGREARSGEEPLEFGRAVFVGILGVDRLAARKAPFHPAQVDDLVAHRFEVHFHAAKLLVVEAAMRERLE